MSSRLSKTPETRRFTVPSTVSIEPPGRTVSCVRRASVIAVGGMPREARRSRAIST